MRIEGCAQDDLEIDEDAAYVACRNGEIYAAPFGSAATLIARGIKYAARQPIAIDSTRLFFKSNTKEISVVPKHGGAPVVFHSGLHVIAMTVAGTDLFVSAFQHGIARIALASGIGQPIVPTTTARELEVANGAVFFLDRSGDKRHAFSALITGSPPVDLGEVDWSVEQFAAAGGRLFHSVELELNSMTRHKLPSNYCRAFVSDGTFVFGACMAGILGRAVADTTWQPIVDEFAQGVLALNTTQVCWANAGGKDTTVVRCVPRPDALR